MHQRKSRFQRRKSPHCESIELNYEKLEKLLIDTIPYHLTDWNDSEFVGLAASRQENDSLAPEATDVVLNALAGAVQHPGLPVQVVASVHTYIGLLRQSQGEYLCAIDSLMKALWLETSSFDPEDGIQVGLTLHRLAIAYRKNGNPKQAITLLDKAMLIYTGCGCGNDHQFVCHALEEKEFAREHLAFRKRECHSTTSLGLKILPSILEENKKDNQALSIFGTCAESI
eukprot:CAMPEP_0195292948 /NCGR_PEP_ID=MMETSP0707-20130614/11288_1 /TAXON_ID=33640 /ORGANISM="Asterionellopsis glacialis, Strain CCMP134" /LENGTH=227 /DNA_ID=CAMNT_0040353545 /DNA_START=104 /DNA_END=787 /DNA_ORIENTATION=-